MLKIEADIYLKSEKDGGMSKPGFPGMQPSFKIGNELIMCRIYPMGNQKEMRLGTKSYVSIVLPYGEKFIETIRPHYGFMLNIGGKTIGQGVVKKTVSMRKNPSCIMKELLTLYRPVGKAEFEKIKKAASKAFPPRLPGQPIFYPVLTYEYAAQIARDWNTKDKISGFVGYVTMFRVRVDYLKKYDVKTVGGNKHREYWIPAEDIGEFNANIVGEIEIIEKFIPASHTCTDYV